MEESASKKKLIILGAGPAGLASAYFYLQKAYDVTIIEKSSSFGGLSQGVKFLDETYDLGPHSFYDNYSETSKNLFKQFIGQGNYEKRIVTKIIQTSSVLIDVPFKLNSIFKQRNLLFYVGYAYFKILAKLSPSKKDIVSDKHGIWIKKKIYSPYCKKYFNLNEEDVSPEFKALLYDNSGDGDGQIYITKSGYIGELWGKIYHYLINNGVEIRFNQQIKNISCKNNNIVSLTTGSESYQEIDQIISTIPLQAIYQLVFPNKAFKFQLSYRATIIVFLEVKQLKTQALYLTNYDTNNMIGRITFCSNWKVRSTKNKKVIAVELWCDSKDDIFSTPELDVKNKVIQLISEIPFISCLENPEYKTIKIPRCFPVLHKEYPSQLNEVNTHLGTIFNLKMIGRHGKFKWDGIDDAIKAAYNE